jgi:hypothetical protein
MCVYIKNRLIFCPNKKNIKGMFDRVTLQTVLPWRSHFFYFTSIVKKWILPSLTSLVNLLKKRFVELKKNIESRTEAPKQYVPNMA